MGVVGEVKGGGGGGGGGGGRASRVMVGRGREREVCMVQSGTTFFFCQTK